MSSPNISFQTIPNNIRKPGVYLEENTKNALQGLTAYGDKVVLLAQKTASGIVASKTPTPIFDDATAALDFGQGSVAHLASKAAISANPNINLTVVGIDDSGSTYAAGSLGVTGVAGAAGSIAIFIGDTEIDVTIPQGWTAAQGATGICGAIQSVQPYLPVTASLVGNSVTLTAKNAGTLGNYIPLTMAITSGLTGMNVIPAEPTGGASDPDLGDYSSAGTVLNSIVGGGYSLIINTLGDATNAGKLKNMVEFVSGPTEQRPATAVQGYTDQIGTLQNVETLASGLNHGRTSIAYASFASGSGLKPIPAQVAAAYGAIIASANDPAVPYDGAVVSSLPAPAVQDRFTRTQQENLLNNGVTPLIVAPGDNVTICRAVSTYTLNTLGVPDPTLLDVTTLRTLDYVRAQVLTRLSNVFARTKLSNRTPAAVRSQVLSVLYKLQELEIVQNVDLYKSGVIVEADSQNVGQLDIKIPTNIVVGLHVIAGTINLILS